MTRVPATTTAPVAVTSVRVSQTSSRRTSSRGGASPSRLRVHSSQQTAIIPIEKEKWNATQPGASCVRTEMPPITACATTPKNSAHDSLTRIGRRGRCRIVAMIAAATAAVTA